MIKPSQGKILMAPALLAMLLPVCHFFWKLPHPALTPPERELARLSCSPLAVVPPAPPRTFSGLSWPIQPSPKRATSVAISSLANLPPPPGPVFAKNTLATAQKPELRYNFDTLPNLSMIYLDGAVKSAVIDGQETHEGSVLGGYRVAKIEETGVLLRRAGKDTWLRLDP